MTRKPRLQMRPHVLEGADGTRVPGEFGFLTVPERRDDPSVTEIELAVARIPSSAPGNAPPIVLLAGGPGGEAISTARAQLTAIARLAAFGDVVLLDQRGVGLSHPNLTSLERFDLPLDEPSTRAATIAEAQRCASACAMFWRERGVELAGYTTIENADDVNDLRRALGADQMRLVGGSYASHLALAILKRHPGTVARAALTGIEGPDDTIKLPSAIQTHLERIAAMSAEGAVFRARIPDLIALMAEVMDRLEREPVVMELIDRSTNEPAKIVIGRYDLQRATTDATGSRAAIAALPRAYAMFEGGDFSLLAQRALAERRRWLGNAMAWAMDAASGVSPARLARIKAEAPVTLCADVIDLPHPHVREAIGAPDLGEDFRAPVESDAEILLVSGSLDGRTPPANAEAVMRGLPNARHLLVEGMSHGDAPRELHGIVAEFLATGDLETDRLEQPLSFEPIEPRA